MVKKLTLEQFIYKAKQKHGSIYDYSMVKYENARTKIIIICKIHGQFLQKPHHHIDGNGCKECYLNERTGKKFIPRKLNTEMFILESKKLHGEKYDYSITDYMNANSNVMINCKIHGIFSQRASTHLEGMGCILCGRDKKRSTKEQFISNAQKIHGNLYDYKLVEYKNAKTDIVIICNIHGNFYQSPRSHLFGNGCFSCNSSKGEKKIRSILNLKEISFEEQYKFPNQTENIRRCKYDFYLPDLNMIIEYHGIQHYEFVPFFHKTHEQMLNRRKRDYEKKMFCLKNNILYIEISYQDDIKKVLNNICNTTKLRGPP